MPYIKNTSLVVQRLKKSDGKTIEIAPGASESVDIEEGNAELEAKLRARTVTLVSKDGKPKAANSKRSNAASSTE